MNVMPLAKVVVILVNWNGKADTLECLASLREDLYPNKRILVVDNGSADGSAAAIRAQFPEVEVLETGANLGFSGGNNAGIWWALDHEAEYVFLLNNDTTVEPQALTTLVQTMETNPRYGLTTPVIHYYDQPEEVWFGGSWVDLQFCNANHAKQALPRDAPPQDIPWSSGCAMLIRAEIIRTLHGFDERYFLYWEDVDLSFRIRKEGYELALIPQARIYHKVSKSFTGISPIAYYYTVRNNLLFMSQHGKTPRLRAVRYISGWRLWRGVRGMVQRNPSDASMLAPTLLAIRDHFLGRYGERHPFIGKQKKQVKQG
jgi:GT2 family glycosyltransferase